MEKSLIIIGPRDSGKTRRAKEMLANHPPINTLWMSFRKRLYRNDMFLFSDCTKTTEVILIDDVQFVGDLFFILSLIKYGCVVRKQGVHEFTIFPKFIVTCHESITEGYITETLLRDFDLVHSSTFTFE